ncbi:MAG TPA: hypothetical protein DEE98_03360 [Elusimicrobia bacterium]|nr:MAG: hypothetical protein A2278_08175 [Elusimicrobia bacterium RIFOXYA12_FULL_49_49]OGS09884.1 MAG: hypothetical protein A2204_05560 [Elusimicrobia bacterium RIFOXYA1_FULL_47_7]OGS11055.1 MAG: hypothetical protein A2386_04310 [Elusimicrobia bacterium RIFOXYB1_FULL_48_9]OGS15959.1 MAG: hypothetical protein A2251_02090 [Elusimicrobia bacterium RIFOXYA2_FULL_47_53]OGS26361.1 MAG: hypothetical protein A2339_03175 [Elusimicrobia bacterium RIFOXYB12_FULL_50_12]OGS29127.1 MAG: hypothetical protein
MKIKQMKLLDRYLGFIACKLFSLFTPRPSKTRPKIDKHKTKNILLMKFFGLGSILLLSPAVKAIKNGFPHSRLVFFTLSRNRELCRSLGIFDEVITLEVDKGWPAFCSSLLSSIFYLWKRRFDMTVDFEFFTRFSAVMTFLSFAPVRVGYHAWETWRGNTHNIQVPFNRYWHIMDNFYNLATYIGLPKNGELKIIRPEVSREDSEFVASLLKDNGASGDFISVHFNASDLSIERRWPYENFIKLINRLVEDYNLKIIFIGSKSESGSVGEIVRAIGGKSSAVLNFAGKLSITQLARLFELSKLVISNDSGPLHLAVAMETPTVSFFGPETPVIYGPLGKSHTVFFKNIDCSPCINVHDRKSVHCYWEKPRCMEAISVDEVYAAIADKLGARE